MSGRANGRGRGSGYGRGRGNNRARFGGKYSNNAGTNFSGNFVGNGNRGFYQGGGNYNRHQDWTRNQGQENEHFERNRFTGGDSDSQEKGFKKFRDPNNLPPERNNSWRVQNFGSKNNTGDFSNREEKSSKPNKSRIEALSEANENNNVSAESSPGESVHLEEPLENKKIKLVKVKTEKIQPDNISVKRKHRSYTISEEKQAESPVKTKSKKKSGNNLNIKQEPVPAEEKRKVVKEILTATNVLPKKAPSSESSSCSSSSSEEEEDPKMPPPMKAIEPVKPKKERSSEDDVVCLGKLNGTEILIGEDEKRACIVCQKQGHLAHKCQMKCKRCNQSSYESQVVCKICGEIYRQNLQSLFNPPNLFSMFMQFMQFMSQYHNANSEIRYPFPQSEYATAPVQATTPKVEVTREDIAKSKYDQEKKKLKSKQNRKRVRSSINFYSNSETDSESSSKATTSTKKRAKSIAREVESPQATIQQQHQLPLFGGHIPGNMPFASGFNSPGYNPMMAFSQMMGFNPAATSFPR